MPSGAPAPSDRAAGRIGNAGTNTLSVVTLSSLEHRFDPLVAASSGIPLLAAFVGPRINEGVHGLGAVVRGTRTATGRTRQIVSEITSNATIFRG